MPKVYERTLIKWVFRRFGVVELRRSGRFKHALRIERYRSLIDRAAHGRRSERLLRAGLVVCRTLRFFVDVKPIQACNLAARIVIILSGKLLVVLEQIGNVIRAQHEATACLRHTHFVERFLHFNDVVARQAFTSRCATIFDIARRLQHRRLSRVRVRRKRVKRFL